MLDVDLSPTGPRPKSRRPLSHDATMVAPPYVLNYSNVTVVALCERGLMNDDLHNENKQMYHQEEYQR
ncbi:hypothetical protein SK128_022056 [Halocaridina rubra]|uniref:Uncharacterized protein n=1 Tax=Halocaridina rubra TaxID=373956 RepID=A0AAN8X6B1_HALRR